MSATLSHNGQVTDLAVDNAAAIIEARIRELVTTGGMLRLPDVSVELACAIQRLWGLRFVSEDPALTAELDALGFG